MPRHINHEIVGHPLVGTEHVYRPDRPAYDPDSDTEGGVLIVGHGMRVMIRAVFENWNGNAGRDMLYVYCMATGYHSHLSPREITGWDSENLATLMLALGETECIDKSAHT